MWEGVIRLVPSAELGARYESRSDTGVGPLAPNAHSLHSPDLQKIPVRGNARDGQYVLEHPATRILVCVA